VIVLGLAAWFLFRKLSWRGLAIAAAGAAALLGAAALTSDLFRARLAETAASIAEYRAGDYTTATTLRLSYLPNTLELVARRPWLGHGVGSFASAYAEQVAGTPYPPAENPHNEYLLLAVQAGLPATLLLALLFAVQLRSGRRLPPPDRRLAEGLLIAMGLGCLFNSFLLDSTEGHWYAYFSALLFAGSGRPAAPNAAAATGPRSGTGDPPGPVPGAGEATG
jgi:O-antigen ligase